MRCCPISVAMSKQAKTEKGISRYHNNIWLSRPRLEKLHSVLSAITVAVPKTRASIDSDGDSRSDSLRDRYHNRLHLLPLTLYSLCCTYLDHSGFISLRCTGKSSWVISHHVNIRMGQLVFRARNPRQRCMTRSQREAHRLDALLYYTMRQSALLWIDRYRPCELVIDDASFFLGSRATMAIPTKLATTATATTTAITTATATGTTTTTNIDNDNGDTDDGKYTFIQSLKIPGKYSFKFIHLTPFISQTLLRLDCGDMAGSLVLQLLRYLMRHTPNLRYLCASRSEARIPCGMWRDLARCLPDLSHLIVPSCNTDWSDYKYHSTADDSASASTTTTTSSVTSTTTHPYFRFPSLTHLQVHETDSDHLTHDWLCHPLRVLYLGYSYYGHYDVISSLNACSTLRSLLVPIHASDLCHLTPLLRNLDTLCTTSRIKFGHRYAGDIESTSQFNSSVSERWW